MSLKVYLVDVSFLPVYIEIKLKFYTIYYTAQCSNSVKGRGRDKTKVLPATLCAVEHQIRQLFTSKKLPNLIWVVWS